MFNCPNSLEDLLKNGVYKIYNPCIIHHGVYIGSVSFKCENTIRTGFRKRAGEHFRDLKHNRFVRQSTGQKKDIENRKINYKVIHDTGKIDTYRTSTEIRQKFKISSRSIVKNNLPYYSKKLKLTISLT